MVGDSARRIGARTDGGREGGGEGEGRGIALHSFASKLKLFRRWGDGSGGRSNPIVSAQRNVFLVRSPVKRVGYARLGPDPGRPPPCPPMKTDRGISAWPIDLLNADAGTNR